MFAQTHFVVQSLSHVRLLATPWTIAYQASLYPTVSWNFLRCMCVELVDMNLIILSSAVPFFCLPSFPASTSLVAQMVNRLPTVWETRVQSLSREALLEKEMATHSSILAWKISWMEEPGRP